MKTRAGLVALLVGCGVLIAVLLAGAAPTWAGPGSGGPFVVNSLLDGADATPGDGACETVTADECTLRAAIQEANAWAGGDTILFAVTGIITLSAELPVITQSLNILGPGADALSVSGAYTLPTTTTYLLAMLGAPSDNVYLISGLEVRGNNDIGIGVDNGFLTLDQLRLSQGGRGLTISGAGTRVTVRASSFIANAALDAGAIWVQAGSLLLVDSRLEGNHAHYVGGALLNDGTTTIRGSTFSGNHAGTYVLGGASGAIGNGSTGHLSIVNSTISGNSVPDNPNSSGAGLYNNGVLTLTNVTLTGNSGSGPGAGLYLATGSSTLLRNTIIANSLDSSDCATGGGTLTDGGYNLIEDNSCGFTGGADPMLAGLADNGGPTYTHALLPGSPAIDAGDPAGCTDAAGARLAFDQRGYQRVVDGDASPGARCDLGAFEYLSSVLNLPYQLFLPLVWP